MKLFDTHSHVSFKAYKEDADEVIRRALDFGVETVTVGSQTSTNQAAIDLAEKYDGVWASVGLHPVHIDAGIEAETANFDDQELDFKPRKELVNKQLLLEQAKHPKVVAIGECGLDYYRIDGEHVNAIKSAQAKAFMDQMEVAAKSDLPIIVHCRDAYEDQRDLINQGMKEFDYSIPGVMHCFTGTWEQAQYFLELGWYISFSGIATFADSVGEVSEKVPLDQMVIETDAPYLTPPPNRGKRNEPLYVQYVARSIAERRGIPVEDLADVTYKNAKKLFNL